MINEDKLIKSLQQDNCFIGDDAAVVPFVDNQNYVITKDILVEDIHFRTKYFTPYDLAHKALHVNLSDIAAMGAKPTYILCGISVPQYLHEYATQFLHHLTQICKNLDVILIGGDTTSSQDKLFISITAIGIGQKDQIKYRNSSKNGDIICIIGDIGFAHTGFALLEQNLTSQEKYISSSLRPIAKITEGIWLGSQQYVHSMMDISDGLYIDLNKLCKSSNKGAVIELDMLQQHLDPEISLQTALEGGEDYSLLCTIDKNSFELLSDQFSNNFNYQVKPIGFITDGDSIKFKKNNQIIDLTVNPFTHFGEKL
jgi:thiamine-monophosphate kinase